MIVQEVMNYLEELAPLNYAEDFDNVGLLIGNHKSEVTGILVTLDTLEDVVDEAIENNCNLIVSFHPIIFSGLKSLTGKTYVERAVLKAIKHDIAIYAMHTALDNCSLGVNHMMCEKLNLLNTKILLPKLGTIKKLITYVPNSDAERVRDALFYAGAGHIGNYSDCSFNIEGIGSFKGNEGSNPAKGTKGAIHFEPETQISVVFEKHLQSKIINTLLKAHPYEEVAYDILTLDNANPTIGMGMLGELQKEMEESQFLNILKSTFKAKLVRHSCLLKKPVKRIAVLGGSGSFAINAAISNNADVFVTADLKYHDFYKAEGKIVLADIGHFESEQFTKNLIVNYLSKKITNFAIILSKINTNPIKYL